MTPEHTKQANAALATASNQTMEVCKELNQARIKELAKQAGGTPYAEVNDWYLDSLVFDGYQLAEFVRLVRENAFAEARWAIESANAERHIDVADCVQIIQELK